MRFGCVIVGTSFAPPRNIPHRDHSFNARTNGNPITTYRGEVVIIEEDVYF